MRADPGQDFSHLKAMMLSSYVQRFVLSAGTAAGVGKCTESTIAGVMQMTSVLSNVSVCRMAYGGAELQYKLQYEMQYKFPYAIRHTYGELRHRVD